MIQVDRCVVCGGALSNQRRGIVAPFLARRIWQRTPFPVHFSECSQCGFQFFNPRLEPSEEMRLYTGYRTPEYQQQRYSFEPWYTAKFNDGLSSPECWQYRKSLLRPIFDQQSQLRDRKYGSVLDFGGDRGDLIADLVDADNRFVYEISGVDLVPGVQALRSIEECRQRTFDLIITSNVLEHVGSPRDIIAQIASIASPGTLIFNEVPYERLDDLQTRVKRIAQAGWLAATRPTVAAQIIGPRLFNLMHEHVNYFAAPSLNRLLELSGFEVLASGYYSMGKGFMASKVVWNLARKPSASSEK